MRVRLVFAAIATTLLVTAASPDHGFAQAPLRADVAVSDLGDGSWEIAPGGIVALFHALAGTPAPDAVPALPAGDVARLYRLRVPLAPRASGGQLRLEPVLGALGTRASAGGIAYVLRLPAEESALVAPDSAVERLKPLAERDAVLAADLLFQVSSYSEGTDGTRTVDGALRRVILMRAGPDGAALAIEVSPASGGGASAPAMSDLPSAPSSPLASVSPPPLPPAVTAPPLPPAITAPPLPQAVTAPPLPPALTTPPVPLAPLAPFPASPAESTGGGQPLPGSLPPAAIFQPPAVAAPPTPAPAPSETASQSPPPVAAPTQSQSAPPTSEPAPAPAADTAVVVAERAGVLRNAPSTRALQVAQMRAGQRFALVKETRAADGVVWAEVKPLPDGAAGFVPRRELVSLDIWQTPVRGPVTRVVDAATLVVGERSVVLGGIEAGPKRLIEIVRPWLSGAASPVSCERRADAAFDCFSADKRDIGETMILNGLAKAGPGAADYYREAEEKARAGKKGLWRGTK